jgi:LmbE family N-acetylglucosaminyl deacetylase
MLFDRPTSVLVVAAHPDDEALGCAGTMARLAKSGMPVHVAFLADGVGSRGTEEVLADAASGLAPRRAAAERACRLLGAGVVHFGDFADNQLDAVPLLDIIQVIEALIARLQPGIVFTHHAGDLNIDHRRVHDAVLAACRPQAAHPVTTILAFEVPSSTEWQGAGSAPAFIPNYFVDISAETSVKQAALEAYAVEMRPWPHPRSYQAVAHLAGWRGATAGVEAAEAFIMVRGIARR